MDSPELIKSAAASTGRRGGAFSDSSSSWIVFGDFEMPFGATGFSIRALFLGFCVCWTDCFWGAGAGRRGSRLRFTPWFKGALEDGSVDLVEVRVACSFFQFEERAPAAISLAGTRVTREPGRRQDEVGYFLSPYLVARFRGFASPAIMIFLLRQM